jgi:N-acyl-D-aspartate/D-glutamate deacylase
MRGVIDTLVGSELLRGSSIPHRNRLAVILIDSAFETACRAFLQHKAKVKLSENHKHRENLTATMKSKLKEIDAQVWDNINFYYEEIRCDFYHQSAGKTVTDIAVLDYRDTVEFVIDTAFATRVRPIVEEQLIAAQTVETADDGLVNPHAIIHLADAKDRTTKVLIAVAAVAPKSVDEVNEYFKREGESLRLKANDFTTLLARNSGSKKLFYFDREARCWKLSKLGRSRLKAAGHEGANG